MFCHRLSLAISLGNSLIAGDDQPTLLGNLLDPVSVGYVRLIDRGRWANTPMNRAAEVSGECDVRSKADQDVGETECVSIHVEADRRRPVAHPGSGSLGGLLLPFVCQSGAKFLRCEPEIGCNVVEILAGVDEFD